MRAGAARRAAVASVVVSLSVVLSPTARAIEAFDGRLQIHGFAEMQIRGIDNGFSEELDLAQWYNVLNVEIEADIAPDGWAFFDLIEAYARLEARYDCIYTRGCGMFRSADTWGDRANHIPARLRDAVDREFGGVIPTGRPDVPRIDNEKPQDLFNYVTEPNPEFLDPVTNLGANPAFDQFVDPGDPAFIPELLDPRFNPELIRDTSDRGGFPGLGGLFSATGPDGLVETSDDPARYVLSSVLDFKFYLQDVTGRVEGSGTRALGPVLPKNEFTNNAALTDRANPFRGERPPSFSGDFRVDSTLDPRLAALDNSTPYGIRLRTAAESDASNRQFADRVNLDQSRRFRGFSGDYSGVVPFAEPELVNIDDLTSSARLPGSVSNASGARNLVNCGPANPVNSCPNGPEGPQTYDEPGNGIDDDGDGTIDNLPPRQGGILELFPDSNAFIVAGLGELPMRPAPDRGNLDSTPNPNLLNAQGLYVPSRGLRHALATQDFDTHPFNIDEDQRAWNRGDSQDDEKEFKEGYFDLEFFDSKLWARIGKQNIVWGKTELFRTTDQFNPQDFSLATLPSLEESRIALWSARFVWSFYTVGPLEDLRVEFAMNFDDFEPTDLGACGEPYTLNVVCGLTLGLAAHGFAGLGVAAIDRPPDPWDSAKGIEIGGRMEWRWGRYSFALTDFYGYDDFPFIDRISTFSREVDLATGRPLIMRLPTERKGSCSDPFPGTVGDGSGRRFDDAGAWQSMTEKGIGSNPGCLKAGGAPGEANENLFGGAQNALENHPANQQLFALVCATQIGGSASIEPAACPLTIFNSSRTIDVLDFGVSEFASATFAGEPTANTVIKTLTQNPRSGNQPGAPAPLAHLNRDGGTSDPILTPRDSVNCVPPFCDPVGAGWSLDGKGGTGTDGVITAFSRTFNKPNDSPESVLAGCNFSNLDACRVFSFFNQFEDALTLDNSLSNQQRALLGCGPFMGTRCDSSDLVRIGGLDDPILVPGAGGVDLLLSDASFLVQSMVGIEGTELRNLPPEFIAELNAAAMPMPGDNTITRVGQGDDPTWLTTASTLVQPATIRPGDGAMAPIGATCTYFNERTGSLNTLPGCRGIEQFTITSTEGGMLDDGTRPTGFQVTFEEGYLPSIDGCVIGRDPARGADPANDPSSPIAQSGAADVRLTIADVPVTVMLPDGSPVSIDATNGGATTYAAELGRQLYACADQEGTQFTSSKKVPDGVDGVNGFATAPGAGTLWHPLAGCRTAGNLETSLGAGVIGPTAIDAVSGSDDGESCSVLLRDFTQNFFNDHMSVQMFRSEGAALSFNVQMFLVATSCNADEDEEIAADEECFDLFRPYRSDRCSFAAPQFCSNVKAFLGGAGVRRNVVRAGGSEGRGGRRTWPWHQGGEIVLRYKKRNVLGFSMDFAEDVTKTNWGVEFTWIASHPTGNNDSLVNVTNVDTMNMTVSVDRPTFINFLNANRTFFFNSQWFFQYIANYRQGMLSNGPFNVLFTFAVFTGYFQDRLLPTFVSIYDFGSRSGGFLPSIGYRFTEAFSATIGFNVFFGREQTGPMPVNPIGPAGNATDPESLKYKSATENLLSNFRKRDEIFLRVRWTF